MPIVATLKINAVGPRTIFTDRGVPLHFRDGMCQITEEMATEEMEDFIRKNAKALGISPMSQEELEELEQSKEAAAAKEAKRIAGQNQVDAILQGRAPELIDAKTPAQQLGAGTSANQPLSVAEKIAQARAAAKK